MKSITMWVVVVALAAVGIAGQACSLSDHVQNVKDNAPGFCKEQSERAVQCSWDWEGPASQDAMQDEIDDSIIDCATACAYGVYLVQAADDPDDEDQIIQHIKGGDVQAAWECLWKKMNMYYKCDDGNFFLEINSSSACQQFNACYMELNLGAMISFSWESDGDYCKQNGDYYIRGM